MRGAEFPDFSTLTATQVEPLLQAGYRGLVIGLRLLKQQFPLQP